MKFTAAVVLGAGLAAASPLAQSHHGNVLIPYDRGIAPEVVPSVHPGSNITAEQESSNWSGLGFTSAPSAGTYTSVSGTFTIPQPSPPNSNTGSWYGTAWVGIDGNTVQNALFQGGVDWSVTRSSSGAISYGYSAWIEWIPNAQVGVNIPVSAGQSITVTCTSTSTTTGYCSYVNHSTGQSVTQNISAPSSSAALSGQNVEWIVEDYSINGGLAPFANYGQVVFTGATCTAGSTVYGVDNAVQIELVQNNAVVSNCAGNSNTQLTCNYS